MLKLITPNWPAPSKVKAYTTTRQGGHSQAPYDSLNLGDHVDDDPKAVAANRATLRELLPSEPVWLKQVHSTKIVTANSSNCTADAVMTTELDKVCVILTADCLPVLFCDTAGTTVAAVHAGWRGLAGGILEATLQRLNQTPEKLLVWLGPAIGPQAFEVREEVREVFCDYLPQANKAFKANGEKQGHWLADLYLLARQRLAHQGATQVFGGEFCTYTDAERFYSYRRNKITGRMASLIWLKGGNQTTTVPT
jgi:YfiH family protein